MADSLVEQGRYQELLDYLITLAQFYDYDNASIILDMYYQVLGGKADNWQELDKKQKINNITLQILALGKKVNMEPVTLIKWKQDLTKNFTKPKVKNDTNTLTQTLRYFKNSVYREIRYMKFSSYNEARIEQAKKLDANVIWRSRVQADGYCKALDGKTMTPEQAAAIWPVHHNCMCTLEVDFTDTTYTKEDEAERQDGLLYVQPNGENAT